MAKLQIKESGKRVVVDDFVNGLLHYNSINQTLEEKIFYHPRELLKKMIEDNTWHNHPKICEQCIDRLCEIGEYGEVANFFKKFIYRGGI